MRVRIPPPAPLDPVTGLSRRSAVVAAVLVVVGVAVGGIATMGGPPAGCPDDAYQCARFLEGEPVVLGGLFPASDGPAGRAVELAAELHGPFRGRPLEVVVYADACGVETAAEGARELATDAPTEPPVVAVVGATCRPAAIPAAQILSDSGISLVSPVGPELPATVETPEFYLRLPPLDPRRTSAFETAYSHHYGPAPDEAIRAGAAAELVLAAAEEVATVGPDGDVLIPRTHLRDELLRSGLVAA